MLKAGLVRFMWIVLLLSLLLTATFYAPIIDFFADRYFLPNDGVRPATFTVKTERRLGFTTSDGIRLLADVHRPAGIEKTPTILVRLPMSNTLGNRFKSDVIGRYWARRGYAVVIQGTRGRYSSGGKFYPLKNERQDGIETLAWLKQQDWFNGHFVMWGGSAFGHTQWAIADLPDGSDAYFIQIASSNFRRMFYPGSAFSLESAVYWAIGSRGNKDRKVDMKSLDLGVTTLPLIKADDAAIGDTDFFNDWVLNRDSEEYWSVIDGHQRACKVQSPVLLMAGWFDPFLPGMLDDFRDLVTCSNSTVSSESRLIIGPWAHAISIKLPNVPARDTYRVDSIGPSIPWFDQQLRLTRSTEPGLAKVKIFVMGINTWRDENEWPLARTRYTDYYLQGTGAEADSSGHGSINSRPASDANPAYHEYLYDPMDPTPSAGGAMLGPRAGVKLQNHLESRPDIIAFHSSAFAGDTEITGPIEVILYVSTDAVSTDFTAKLVDVYPDGSAYNLSDGILRREYAINEDTQRSDVTEITIQLWPTSCVLREGHRLRLEISSSNFPRYDRNLNTGEDHAWATDAVIARQRIFHSGEYPSRLVLPVIPARAL